MRSLPYHSCRNCCNFVKTYKTPSGVQNFCSHSCASKYKTKYDRFFTKCKYCGKEFKTNHRPFSNNSGNYCSLQCRNDGYVKKGYLRSRWRSRKEVFLNEYGKNCSLCWSTTNIEVHHIVPKRAGGSDKPLNLVVLCHKCHAKEEMKSKKINQSNLIEALVLAAEYEERWLLNKGLEISLC